MADQIKGIVHAIMEGEKGINAKTGTNTLIDSNLYNDMVADVKDLELIQFLIHDYTSMLRVVEKLVHSHHHMLLQDGVQEKGYQTTIGLYMQYAIQSTRKVSNQDHS